MFVVMNEDESVSELVIPPVVAIVPEMSREPAQMEKTSTEVVIVKELSVYLIHRMHVNQLKAELSKRAGGREQERIEVWFNEKLNEAVANNVPMMECRPAQITNNVASY